LAIEEEHFRGGRASVEYQPWDIKAATFIFGTNKAWRISWYDRTNA
jgi:hypothetical protein